MNRPFAIAIATLILLAIFTGCYNQNDNQTSDEGPFSNDNWNDFPNAIPVSVDDEIINVCHDWAISNGYEIDRSIFKSVLLGESLIEYVFLHDDSYSDLLDASDYLVIFENVRLVIDSEIIIILGRIPYV